MAYVDFSPEGAFRPRVAGKSASPVEASRFTSVELQVIAAAERQDVLRERAPHSPWWRFARFAFGLELERPLADPRLERLRRFASLATHHPERLDDDERRAFVAAGFTEGQAAGLLSYLSGRRSRTPALRPA